jgi:invasion protein IalB
MESEALTLCNGTEARGELKIASAVIKAGVSLGGVVGSLRLPDASRVTAGTLFGSGELPQTGKVPECAAEGDAACVNRGVFRAVDTSTLATKMIANASAAGVSGAVVLPSQADVRSGTQFGAGGTGKTGNLAVPVACTSDGAQACVVAGNFAAAATTGLASKVVSTAMVAGVPGNVVLPAAAQVAVGVSYGFGGSEISGTRFSTKQCRNAADLGTWDSSGLSNVGIGHPVMGVNGTNVLLATDELGWDPGIYHLEADLPVQLLIETGTLPGGLSLAKTYYVIPSGTNIKLSESKGGPPVDVTSIGSGILKLTSVPDGVADIWETMDDFNAGATFPPSAAPGWSTSLACDSSNFEDISTSGGPSLTPSNTIPVGGNVTFSQIWRDNLSGLYVSNILYDGSGSKSWSDAIQTCRGLDSGDGTGNWHLPTQKELMQLYVNGASKITVSGGAWETVHLWSASGSSSMLFNAWVVDLSSGKVYDYYRNFRLNGAICVR